MGLGLNDNLLVRVRHHEARIEEIADAEFEAVLLDYLEQELASEAAEPDIDRIWIISELVRKNFAAERAIRCVRKWFDSRCMESRRQKVGMIGGFLLQQLSQGNAVEDPILAQTLFTCAKDIPAFSADSFSILNMLNVYTVAEEPEFRGKVRCWLKVVCIENERQIAAKGLPRSQLCDLLRDAVQTFGDDLLTDELPLQAP